MHQARRPELRCGVRCGMPGGASSFAPPVFFALVFCICAALLAGVPTTARAADDATPAAESSAADEAAGFGLTGFTRYNRGAQRAVDGTDIGYRFPLSDGATVVVVHTPETVWVHVDEGAAEAAGFAADDPEDAEALFSLVKQLDEEASRGGELLADAQKPWVVTTADEVTEGAYRYQFVREVGEGSYTAVLPAEVPLDMTPSQAAAVSGLDLGDGALWVDDAQLLPAADIAAQEPVSATDQIGSFLSTMDYRPLWVSLKTSAVALAVTFVLGLLAAWKTMGTSSRLKGLLDSVFTIPMVLPPTVCGFLLLLLFGQSTAIGRFLIDHGIALVFTWPAAVLSAIVVSFPLMYRTALGAFEALDAQMLDAARTLGWSETRIFRRLMLPLAWPSIAAGTVLAFARAMGEFGCTLFFAGNYAGETQTIPIAIYFQWMSGNTEVALFWVVVVILLSFAVILLINLYTARSQRYRARGGMPLAHMRRGLHVGGRKAGAHGGVGRSVAFSGDTAGAGRERDATLAADPCACSTDTLDFRGGDALRIDREALRALLLGEDGEAPSGRTGDTPSSCADAVDPARDPAAEPVDCPADRRKQGRD